jgi:hypothetical protein
MLCVRCFVRLLDTVHRCALLAFQFSSCDPLTLPGLHLYR